MFLLNLFIGVIFLNYRIAEKLAKNKYFYLNFIYKYEYIINSNYIINIIIFIFIIPTFLFLINFKKNFKHRYLTDA